MLKAALRSCSSRAIPMLFIVAALCVTPAALAQAIASELANPVTNGSGDKDRIILELLRRVEALERKLASLPGAALPPAAAALAAPGKSAAQTAQPSPETTPGRPASSAPAAASTPIGAAPAEQDAPANDESRRALERALVREGGLLLPPGTFEFEPRLTYDHRAFNGLNLVSTNGRIEVAQQITRTSLLELSLGLRAGLPMATQIEIELPYSFNRERRIIAGGRHETDKATGFGNFEIGLTRQFMDDAQGSPGLLGTLRWSRRTSEDDFGSPVAAGSSFAAWTAGLTLVKRHDPLVFFGTLSRTISDARTISNDRIEPGDATGIRLGTILAASPDASLRFDFEFSRANETRMNGAKIAGSDATAGTFNTGLSLILSPEILLGVDAGIGLTTHSPDFRLGLSLPIRF